MHPFTYFSLNQGLDDYYLNYLTLQMKLQIFGKQVFQELIL